MADYRKTSAVIGVVLGMLSLAACAPRPATAAPTIDLNPFRTEVASTVLAQVTQTVCPVPSDTPSPSPTVTAINVAAITPTLMASTTPVLTGTLVTGTPATGTPEPVLEDRAQWVSQSILDGSMFAPGETFTMTWRLENVGSSTWTAGYLLRHYSGDAFGAIKEIPLGRDVPPGQTAEISVLMKAPNLTGDFRSDWVLSNQNRSNFKEPVFLKITVAVPTTTPSPSATASS